MEFIVAVDARWGIGQAGGMLYHLPKDLAFFKRTTLGQIILMGRRTFESLPKGALPDRINVVLTGNRDYEAPGAIVIHDLAELEPIAAAHPERRVLLCGGGRLYHDLLDRCEGGYLTRLGVSREADTHFPDLDRRPDWVAVERLEHGLDGDIPYEIIRYERRIPRG